MRIRPIRPAAERRRGSRIALDEGGRYLGIPRNGAFSRLTSVQGTGCGTLGDTAAVAAFLDRLLHHAHVLTCGPRSRRTRLQGERSDP